MLVNRGHTAMVEHGTVYLKYDIIEHGSMNLPNKYHFNKYSVVTVGNEPLHGCETPEYKEKFDGHTYAYITTNYRVLLQTIGLMTLNINVSLQSITLNVLLLSLYVIEELVMSL